MATTQLGPYHLIYLPLSRKASSSPFLAEVCLGLDFYWTQGQDTSKSGQVSFRSWVRLTNAQLYFFSNQPLFVFVGHSPNQILVVQRFFLSTEIKIFLPTILELVVRMASISVRHCLLVAAPSQSCCLGQSCRVRTCLCQASQKGGG